MYLIPVSFRGTSPMEFKRLVVAMLTIEVKVKIHLAPVFREATGQKDYIYETVS